MTRSIGLAIFFLYTLAATITVVSVILLTSKTESNNDEFSPNETMTISKDDENSTILGPPNLSIPVNAKEDSNNTFSTDSTTTPATITSTPISTTTTAATSTATTSTATTTTTTSAYTTPTSTSNHTKCFSTNPIYLPSMFLK